MVKVQHNERYRNENGAREHKKTKRKLQILSAFSVVIKGVILLLTLLAENVHKRAYAVNKDIKSALVARKNKHACGKYYNSDSEESVAKDMKYLNGRGLREEVLRPYYRADQQ
jgi:hypothetical protein